MLFCIDIGNTNIVMGLFAGQELVQTWRLSTNLDATADEYSLLINGLLQRAGLVSPETISGIAMCSVVPRLTETLDEVCRKHLGQDPLQADNTVRTDLPMRVDRPQDVGADRLANCVAVRARGGGPACIVDFGTATKFDALSADNEFLGGAIAPGLGIAAEALFSKASKLHRISLKSPAQAIGRNTVEAMQAGIILGYVGLVESLIGHFAAELGPAMRVIATGGLVSVIAPQIPAIQHIDPWLTLEGLRVIWHLNRT